MTIEQRIEAIEKRVSDNGALLTTIEKQLNEIIFNQATRLTNSKIEHERIIEAIAVMFFEQKLFELKL